MKLLILFFLFFSGSLIGQMTITSGRNDYHLRTKNGYREYTLYVPAGHTANKQYELVICIPGQNGNPDRNVDDMEPYADDYDYILMGIYSIETNYGFPVGQDYEVDDKQYIWDLISLAKKAANITKVYIVGESNGGALAHYMNALKDRKIDAFVSIAGSFLVGQTIQNQAKIDVLNIHGEDDNSVPIAGGIGTNGYNFQSAQSTFDAWATHNNNLATTLTNVNYSFTNAVEYVKDNGVSENRYLKVLLGDQHDGHNVGGFNDADNLFDINLYICEFLNQN